MRWVLSVFAIVALLSLGASGCGEDAEGGRDVPQSSSEDVTQGPSQAYGEALRGLRDAALSESPYGAARRAKGLPPDEAAAIEGFCELVWQIDVNQEAAKLSVHPYMENRLKARAAIELGRRTDSLEEAVRELIEVVDLRQLDKKLSRSYKKACYG